MLVMRNWTPKSLLSHFARRQLLDALVRPTVTVGLDKHTPSPTAPTNSITTYQMTLQVCYVATRYSPLSPYEKTARTNANPRLPALA